MKKWIYPAKKRGQKCIFWQRKQCLLSYQNACSNSEHLDFRPPVMAKKYLTEDHYSDVIMITIASQITGVSIVYSADCSGADQRKHQSSASLAIVRETAGDWWILLTKGQWHGKCFHLMTSSWSYQIEDLDFAHTLNSIMVSLIYASKSGRILWCKFPIDNKSAFVELNGLGAVSI